MKGFLQIIALGSVLCFAPLALAQDKPNTPLTNASVVKLAKAGFKEKTIISIISSRIPNFDLSPDRMIELKRSGVSEKVILAMLARQEGMDLFDDDSWGDDPTFSSADPKLDPSGSGSGSGSMKNPDGSNSTNIFGSSGSSRSQTRTRGNGSGASSGDSELTGSATVRILRPPTEAGGGAPPRLDKQPTLTNDSIVELVEAGFSEGTIIRRIEQSPVNFDLAVTKLDDLRRRRVSDKILAAMKTAMGEGSSN
jgi:hypothetical protein